MRFLDEQGVLHKQPPKTFKSSKKSKLWMLGLEWQSVEKGSWAAAARNVASNKTVGGVVSIQGQKRLEAAHSKVKRAMHVGVWALNFIEEEELHLKLTDGCYSLAAVFALAAQSQNSECAALYLDLGIVDGASHAYFCRIFNGVPVTDAVFPKEKATRLAQDAQADGDAVFANDQDLLTASTPIDLEWFSHATDKLSLIKKVPVNWMLIALSLVVFASLALAYTAYQQYQEKAQKAELVRLAAENDPVPKYLAALSAQRLHVGMDRAGLGKLYSDIMKTPRAISGWKLSQIECTLEGCGATWQRTQGTFSDAKQYRPADILLIPSVDDQGRMTATSLSIIKTVFPVKPTVVGLPVELPKYDAYVLSAGNTLQRWANAGISVQAVGIASTWPDSPGAQGLQLPGVVSKGDFTLTGVNAVFGMELIGQLPPSVRIRKFVVRTGADALTFDLIGNFYVTK